MKNRGIQAEDQMLDLVGEKCERNVEFRIVRCEDRPDGVGREVKNEGVVVDEDVIVPGDEVVIEGRGVDC